MHRTFISLVVAGTTLFAVNQLTQAETIVTAGSYGNYFFVDGQVSYINYQKRTNYKTEPSKQTTLRQGQVDQNLRLRLGLGYYVTLSDDNQWYGSWYGEYEKYFTDRKQWIYRPLTNTHSNDLRSHAGLSPQFTALYMIVGHKTYGRLTFGTLGVQDAVDVAQIQDPTQYIVARLTAFDRINRFAYYNRDLSNLEYTPHSANNPYPFAYNTTSKYSNSSVKGIRYSSDFDKSAHYFSISYLTSRGNAKQTSTSPQVYDQQYGTAYSYTINKHYTLGVTGAYNKLVRTRGSAGAPVYAHSYDFFTKLDLLSAKDYSLTLNASYGKSYTRVFQATNRLYRHEYVSNLYFTGSYQKFDGSLGINRYSTTTITNNTPKTQHYTTYFATAKYKVYTYKTYNVALGVETSVTKRKEVDTKAVTKTKRLATTLDFTF